MLTDINIQLTYRLQPYLHTDTDTRLFNVECFCSCSGLAQSLCNAVEYFCVRESLSIVNVFVFEADTYAIHRTCVLFWSVFVVWFPNWHESGCHSQEQVDWGTRLWFCGQRQRCRHNFFQSDTDARRESVWSTWRTRSTARSTTWPTRRGAFADFLAKSPFCSYIHSYKHKQTLVWSM